MRAQILKHVLNSQLLFQAASWKVGTAPYRILQYDLIKLKISKPSKTMYMVSKLLISSNKYRIQINFNSYYDRLNYEQ